MTREKSVASHVVRVHGGSKGCHANYWTVKMLPETCNDSVKSEL